MTTSKQISRRSLNALQARLQGAIIAPGDPGYDSARMAWNLSVQQFPAAVIMAADTADIAEAVRFARQAGLKVGVQATGHNVIRPADGSLLINTSQMAGVSVGAAARTAHRSRCAMGRSVGKDAGRRTGAAAGVLAGRRRGRLHAGRWARLAGAQIWPGSRHGALV